MNVQNNYIIALNIFIAIISIVFPLNIYAAENDVDELYAKAIILYEQGKQAAFPILEQAAALGNTDAMCLLGAANNSGLMGSDEADKWYQMAAQHEAPCGYVALLERNEVTDFINGKKDGNLENLFLEKTIQKAESGNIKAMNSLSYFYATKK